MSGGRTALRESWPLCIVYNCVFNTVFKIMYNFLLNIQHPISVCQVYLLYKHMLYAIYIYTYNVISYI